jgi:enoyl-CoA hydratase
MSTPGLASSASADGQIRVERDGHRATVTIDRAAKLNALTPEMLDELGAALEQLAGSDARVVVIAAAPARAFCVGADIDRFAGLTPQQMWAVWTRRGHRVFETLARLPQPTIAAIGGHAFGGGLELALACDLRVLSQDARIALPETGLGTVPGWGGTERVTELAGRGRAKELVLTRRQLGAPTALEWGLVTAVAAAGGLDAAVEQLVEAILGGAPFAVQLAKQIIDAAADGAPSAVLEALAGGLTAASAELTEGVAAFRERRSPDF